MKKSHIILIIMGFLFVIGIIYIIYMEKEKNKEIPFVVYGNEEVKRKLLYEGIDIVKEGNVLGENFYKINVTNNIKNKIVDKYHFRVDVVWLKDEKRSGKTNYYVKFINENEIERDLKDIKEMKVKKYKKNDSEKNAYFMELTNGQAKRIAEMDNVYWVADTSLIIDTGN